MFIVSFQVNGFFNILMGDSRVKELKYFYAFQFNFDYEVTNDILFNINVIIFLSFGYFAQSNLLLKLLMVTFENYYETYNLDILFSNVG